MAASAAVGSSRAPLARGALARLFAASLRSSAAALTKLLTGQFSIGKIFLAELLLLYNFFLAELTGRAPRELRNTKTFRTPNANHGRLTVLEPPDRLLGR